MTEPTEEELERAERIRRLREGEAEPRRERRRPRLAADDEIDGGVSAEAGDADVDHRGPVQPGGEVEMPADAPEDLTVASLFLTEDLRGKTERIEEHLHLRYSVEFGTDLDGPRHVRPLALYLGLRQLERVDLAEVRGLFEQVDVVESPEE